MKQIDIEMKIQEEGFSGIWDEGCMKWHSAISWWERTIADYFRTFQETIGSVSVQKQRDTSHKRGLKKTYLNTYHRLSPEELWETYQNFKR